MIITTSSVRFFRAALLWNRRPMNRDVADAGNLLQRRGHRVVDQAGNRERLSVAQLQLGFRAARAQRRNPEALQLDAVGEIERADLGTDLQVDAIAVDRRREVQPDAELLELDGDGVAAAPLRHRNREFAAGEEARFLAALGDQVRLGQALEQPAIRQRLDHHAEVEFLAEQEHVQEVAERELALRRW